MLAACVAAGLLLANPAPAAAQSAACDLEILTPLPIGVSGVGKDADNRIYRAYPGLEYRIPVAPICGTFPYTFTLNNEPAGMTVVNAGTGQTCGIASTVLSLTHAVCGLVTWPNPVSTATDVEVCVTDSAETPDTVCAMWTITVTNTIGAGGFCFVDSSAAGGGNGSLATPYNSLLAAYTSCGARSILYLRYGGGTEYTFAGISPTDTECAEVPTGPGYYLWEESSRPVIWIGYPGESRPVINFGYADDHVEVPCLRLGGENLWVERVHIRKSFIQAIQISPAGNFGPMFFDNEFAEGGPGQAEANAAFLMFLSNYPNLSYGGIILENWCHDVDFDDSFACFKFYSTRKLLVRSNLVEDVFNRTAEAESQIAIKSDNTDYTVQANIVRDIPALTFGLGGNQNIVNDISSGEWSYNLVQNPGGRALELNAVAGATRVFRNTLIGDIFMQATGASSGPFALTQNVIENDGGTGGACTQRLSCFSVTDHTRYGSLTSNLQGVEGANTDANGELEGSALTANGPSAAVDDRRGHMLGEGDGDPVSPGTGRPRFRLRVQFEQELQRLLARQRTPVSAMVH